MIKKAGQMNFDNNVRRVIPGGGFKKPLKTDVPRGVSLPGDRADVDFTGISKKPVSQKIPDSPKVPDQETPQKPGRPAVETYDSPYRVGIKTEEKPGNNPTVLTSFDQGGPGSALLNNPADTIKESPAQWLANKLSAASGKAVSGLAKFVNFIGGGNQEMKEARALTNKVISLDKQMGKLSDSQLTAKTSEFRDRLKAGESLDKILPEAFAVAREVDWRVLKMKPYPEQILGGVCAHKGHVVEMKTGEGKTLMETMPVYLNALKGDGVHMVTANSYLAGRDMKEMEPVFGKLGLTVGILNDDDDLEAKKAANKADVTYGTCSQFGFQYLRDNLAHDKDHQVGRDLSKVFTLVDEVDSILIDEARTPLIISSRSDKSDSHVYNVMAETVSHLKEGVDYEVDRKKRQAYPTEKGIEEVEKKLGIKNLYSDKDPLPEHLQSPRTRIAQDLVSYFDSAVKAKALFDRDVNYMVDRQSNEIKIIDEFTGRSMPGRRFSQGVHAAIEAKEGLPVNGDSMVLASISIQNYFNQYGNLAGMTGTAKSSQREFYEVFGKGVDVVPTHKPMIRKDMPDLVFQTKQAKQKAIVAKVKELNEKGQPVLIGTRSIEDSEALSKLLVSQGIDHSVLNAKYHKAEADIISQAGAKGSVVIATNMAGRGTDIKLGGDPKVLAKKLSDVKGTPYNEALAYCKELCGKEKEEVKQLGGLFVLGTEHSDSRRVDDQLRGRSGRQGDPGESQFYVSLEDDQVRWFAGDSLQKMVERAGLPEDQAIGNTLVRRMVNQAQEKVENKNLDSRKEMLKYDKVMNLQRDAMYSDRQGAIEGDDLSPVVTHMMDRAIDELVDDAFKAPADKIEQVKSQFSPDPEKPISKQEARMILLAKDATELLNFNFGPMIKKGFQEGKLKKPAQFKSLFKDYGHKLHQRKRDELGAQTIDKAQQQIFLESMDMAWVDQQTAISDLREGIGLRSYAQQDPQIAYQEDSKEFFDMMQSRICKDTVATLMRARLAPPRVQIPNSQKA